MAIALVPAAVLPMVILSGILSPIHEMGPVARRICWGNPFRWAFETMMVLESDSRKPWPAGKAAGPGQQELSPVSPTALSDLADFHYPTKHYNEADQTTENHRVGPRVSTLALVTLFLVLVVAIPLILRARDLH